LSKHNARQIIACDIQACHTTSNREPFDTWRLSITDDASRTQIVEFSLGPDDFLKLMKSQNITVPCEVVAGDALDRLGKEYVHEIHRIPAELITSYNPDTSKLEAEEWADSLIHSLPDEQWENVYTSKNRDGWHATLEKWVTPTGGGSHDT